MGTVSGQTTEVSLTLRLSRVARERLARRAAESGRDVAAVASELIERAVTAPPDTASASAADERRHALDEWLSAVRSRSNRYPAGFLVDDDRETIYLGRGE